MGGPLGDSPAMGTGPSHGAQTDVGTPPTPELPGEPPVPVPVLTDPFLGTFLTAPEEPFGTPGHPLTPATAPGNPLCDTPFLLPATPPQSSPTYCPVGASRPLSAPSPTPRCPPRPPLSLPPHYPPQNLFLSPPQSSLSQCSPNPSLPLAPQSSPSLNVPSLSPSAAPQRSPPAGTPHADRSRSPPFPAHLGAGCAASGRPWRRPGGGPGCRWPSPPPPSSPRSNEGEAAGGLTAPAPPRPGPPAPAPARRAACALHRRQHSAASLSSAPRGVSGVFNPSRAGADCGRGRGGAAERLRWARCGSGVRRAARRAEGPRGPR